MTQKEKTVQDKTAYLYEAEEPKQKAPGPARRHAGRIVLIAAVPLKGGLLQCRFACAAKNFL